MENSAIQLINRKEKENVQLQKALKDLNLQNKRLEEENSKLKSDLAKTNNELSHLSKLVKQYQENLKNENMNSSEIKKENDIFQRYLTSSLTQTNFLIQKVKELEDELSNRINDLKSTNNMNITLSLEKENLRDIEENLRNRERIFESAMNKLLDDLSKLSKSNKEVITDLQTKNAYYEKEIQALRERESTNAGRIVELEQQIQNLSLEKEQEIQSYKDALNTHFQQMHYAKNEIIHLQTTIKDRDYQISELMKKLVNAEQFNQEKNANLLKENEELKYKQLDMEQEILLLKNENQTFKSKEEAFQARLQNLSQESYDDLPHATLLEKANELRQILAHEKNEKDKLSVKFDKIKKELSEKIPELMDTYARINKISEENASLKEKNLKLAEEFKKTYQEKAQLEQEVSDLRYKLDNNFDATFLSQQLSKLLVENHKLKIIIQKNIGNQADKLLGEDERVKYSDRSDFFYDIDDLQKKYMLLLKRYKDEKSGNVIEIEDEPTHKNESQPKISSNLVPIKKLPSSQVITIEEDNSEDATVSKQLYDQAKEELQKLRKENYYLQEKVNALNSSQKKVLESSIGPHTKDNENEIKRLIKEKEEINNRLVAKEKEINGFKSRLTDLTKKVSELENKANILTQQIEIEKSEKIKLQNVIKEKGDIIHTPDEQSLADKISIIDNISLKSQLEQQSFLLKQYETEIKNLKSTIEDIKESSRNAIQNLSNILFQGDDKIYRHSPSEEILILRSHLYHLKSMLSFYESEFNNQRQEYENDFNKIEEILNEMFQNYARLQIRLNKQENDMKNEIAEFSMAFENKLNDMKNKVENFIEGEEEAEQEEDYEEWKHIDEYRELENKLQEAEKKHSELLTYIEELKDNLLHEREINISLTKTKQQENQEISK